MPSRSVQATLRPLLTGTGLQHVALESQPGRDGALGSYLGGAVKAGK